MDWTTELKSNTEKFEREFAQLPEHILCYKPHHQSWSILEVIEHLTTTNSRYFSIFDEVLEGRNRIHWVGKIPGAANGMGKMLLKSMDPSRRKKVKTVPVFEPEVTTITPDLWPRFLSCQERLIEYVSQFSKAQLSTIISSPASTIIVYRLKTALDIITTHELRHFHQAIEVKQLAMQSLK